MTSSERNPVYRTTDPDYNLRCFKRHVDGAAGIYYRLDKGQAGGRNSASTDETLRMHVEAARAIQAALLDDEHADDMLWTYLDSHPRYAEKWNRVERRFYGART